MSTSNRGPLLDWVFKSGGVGLTDFTGLRRTSFGVEYFPLGTPKDCVWIGLLMIPAGYENVPLGDNIFFALGLILGKSTLWRDAFEVMTRSGCFFFLICLRPSWSHTKLDFGLSLVSLITALRGSDPTSGILCLLVGTFFEPAWNSSNMTVLFLIFQTASYWSVIAD